MSFGSFITTDPKELSLENYRELLTKYGVIAFKYFRLTTDDLNRIMSYFGPLQDWKEQQAPIEYTDKNINTLINLDNNDFLGNSRMGWHTDQTYLTSSYLPIRCLYSPVSPDSGNITSFLDGNYISDLILSEYPEIENSSAKYYMSSDKKQYSIRPLFSYCEHTQRKMIRVDSRMSLIDEDIDANKFAALINRGIKESPKFNVTWNKWYFVIFDNNRCPHRRSEMNGKCHLHRLTSTFWLN